MRSLYWTENSKFLVSTCNWGGIFFWRANFKDFGYNKGQDEIEPESSYYDESSFFFNWIYDERFDALITLTSHSVLKILRNKGSSVYFEDKMPGYTATWLAFCKELSTIVLGTAEGKLIFRNWPIIVKHFIQSPKRPRSDQFCQEMNKGYRYFRYFNISFNSYLYLS